MKLTKAETKFMAKLGKRGGRARAKSLSAKRRHDIALMGAAVRWARVKAAAQAQKV